MQIYFGCVVEGHGEVGSVPILIRRIVGMVEPGLSVCIPQPVRIPKSRLIKAGELERAVDLTVRKLGGPGAVLVLLDSDEDCPAALGPALLQRVIGNHPGIPVGVVLAKQEYESWFLAAASSLKGQRDLSRSIASHPQPESVRGAKEWLDEQMEIGGKYSETLDQPALTQIFNLQLARSVDSFDKCFREVERLAKVAKQNAAA